MPDEKYRAFLVDFLHADRVPHQNRHLYDHLCGTYDLLAAWGNPAHVCLAGLFHSIYGTKHFRRATLPFSQRRQLRQLIGYDAEQLAYLFCVADRPNGLIGQWGRTDIVIHDRHQNDLVVLNRQELLWLLEIEAANLLDQKYVRDPCLVALSRMPLTATARAAMVQATTGVALERAPEIRQIAG